MKKNKDNNMLKLNSVGCVLDTKSGMVFPVLDNGNIEKDEGTYLQDIWNNDEWINALNHEETISVYTTGHKLNMFGSYKK